MTEERFGWQVRQLLNKSAQDVSPSISTRLEKARQLALSRKKQNNPNWAFNIVPQISMASCTAGGHSSGFDLGSMFSSLGGIIPAIALAIGIVFVADNQINTRASQLAEVDTEVLSDDLPINAYLDQGFSLYVGKKSSERSSDTNGL